jgi:hypothetical protein
MRMAQFLDLNVIMFSAGILALTGLGLTFLFRKRLEREKYRKMLAVELVAFSFIFLGYGALNPDGWANRLIEISSIPFGIWGFVDLYRGRPGKE